MLYSASNLARSTFPHWSTKLRLIIGRFLADSRADDRMQSVPSEIHNLEWFDINRETNTIRLRPEKTKHCGKGERLVPIFNEVSELLQKQFDDAEVGEVYVFPKLRHHSNAATTGEKIVKKAGLASWPKFWTCLRASCETDLMDRYGIRKACQWIGNTVVIAMRNYAQVKKTDYVDAGEMSFRKSDAESGAVRARIEENRGEAIQEDTEKTTVYVSSVAEAGLEQPGKSPGKSTVQN